MLQQSKMLPCFSVFIYKISQLTENKIVTLQVLVVRPEY